MSPYWTWSAPGAERCGGRASSDLAVIAALLLCAMALGVRGQVTSGRVSNCEAMCAGLAEAIRAAPELLVMRIEDALVFDEACAPEIVTTAMNVVGGEPALVQQIVETAIKVAPRQSDRIREAARTFSIPTAPAVPVAVVPEVEVRAAIVPILVIDGEQAEVKRAQMPVMIGNIPLEEIRRAEPPPRALSLEEAAALPFAEIALLPAADMTLWPSEEFALPANLMPLEPGGEPPLPDAQRALLAAEQTMPPPVAKPALLPGEEVRRAEPHWK